MRIAPAIPALRRGTGRANPAQSALRERMPRPVPVSRPARQSTLDPAPSTGSGTASARPSRSLGRRPIAVAEPVEAPQVRDRLPRHGLLNSAVAELVEASKHRLPCNFIPGWTVLNYFAYLYRNQKRMTMINSTSEAIAEYSDIANKILSIRGTQVILDKDLAVLYGVENRALKQAVRRNLEKFPDDFMFRLSISETNELILSGVSQFVTPSGYNAGGADVFAFTEQGVAMLSSGLRSDTAVEVSIRIMDAFVRMRNFRHLDALASTTISTQPSSARPATQRLLSIMK